MNKREETHEQLKRNIKPIEQTIDQIQDVANELISRSDSPFYEENHRSRDAYRLCSLLRALAQHSIVALVEFHRAELGRFPLAAVQDFAVNMIEFVVSNGEKAGEQRNRDRNRSS